MMCFEQIWGIFVKIWWILAKMFRDFPWCSVIETPPYPCTPCRLVRWLWVSWAFTKYIGLIGWKWSNLHMSLSLSLSLFLWKKFEKVWKKLKKCGKVWKSVEKFEKAWKSLKKFENVWKCLEKFGKSLKKCGKVWKSLKSCGKV